MMRAASWRSMKRRSTSFVRYQVPRAIAAISSYCSSFMAGVRPLRFRPALFTSTSTRPVRSFSSATSASISAGSARSARTAKASGSFAASSSAAAALLR